MAKFMVLYNSDVKASELMAQASPEAIKASMGDWIQWRDEASKTVKVEFGPPVQAVSNVTAAGVAESDMPVSGYSMLDGEREAILDLLQTHPHLKRPGTSIDLLELLPIPGLQATA